MAGYDYDFVSQVSEDYVCRICHCPMRDPVQTKCGHRFCRECLLDAKRKTGRAECPMDRKPLNIEKDTFDDKAAERSILYLTIKCPNSKCDWQGELGNLQDHMPKCDYKEIECTLCGVKKLLKEMEVHNQEECEMRKVSCPCGEGMLARDLEKHNNVCPEFRVKCPKKCGPEKIRRKKIADHIQYHCPKSVVCCTYRELGCAFESPRKNLKQHLESKAKDHLLLVLERNKQFQEKIERRCDLLERNTSNFIDKEELLKINQELKTHQRKYDKLTWDLEGTETQMQQLIENNFTMNQELKTQQRKYDILTWDLQGTETQMQQLIENNFTMNQELKTHQRKYNKLSSDLEDTKMQMQQHSQMLERQIKKMVVMFAMIVMGAMIVMVAIFVIYNRPVSKSICEKEQNCTIFHLLKKLFPIWFP